MSRTKNKKTFTFPRLIILLLIVMISIFGFWLFLRAAIVKGMTSGIHSAESQGYQIGHGGLNITGFPFTVSARSNDISVRAPTSPLNDPSKNWALQLDQLTAHSATLTPLSWDITHRGTARIDMRSPIGERYMFDINPAPIDLQASVGINKQLKSAHLDIGKSRLSPLVGNHPALIELANAKVDLTTAGMNAHILLNANDLVFSDQAIGVFKQAIGTKLQGLKVDAIVHDWPILEERGFEAWQNTGGKITLSQASLEWGQLDIVCDVDLHFNQGTPEGLLNIRIRNPLDLIQNLANSGAINLNPAIVSQLSRLLDELEIDGEGRTELELNFKNHQIKYGFLPIGTY